MDNCSFLNKVRRIMNSARTAEFDRSKAQAKEKFDSDFSRMTKKEIELFTFRTLGIQRLESSIMRAARAGDKSLKLKLGGFGEEKIEFIREAFPGFGITLTSDYEWVISW